MPPTKQATDRCRLNFVAYNRKKKKHSESIHALAKILSRHRFGIAFNKMASDKVNAILYDNILALLYARKRVNAVEFSTERRVKIHNRVARLK